MAISKAVGNCLSSNAKVMPKAENVMYHPIIISDHSPLSIDIQISSGPCYPIQWKFNTLLLSDDKFHKFITNAIDDFIVFNQSGSEPLISKALLWESLKAYLRGQIITFPAHIKKFKNLNYSETIIRFRISG